MVRFATLNDNTLSIANLIYETDTIMPFIFGKKEVALNKIKSLIESNDHSFSFQNILVYENEKNQIDGVLLSYIPSKIDKQKEHKKYKELFSLNELIMLWLKSLLLVSIDNKSKIDGLYIQNICVNGSCRGKGIGSQLLDAIEHFAKEKNYNSLWLDVSVTNQKAKMLYERYGFDVVSEHSIFLSKKGFFRMKKKLNKN